MKILIFGATGFLGKKLIKLLDKQKNLKVIQLMRKLKEGYTGWAKVVKNLKIEKQCKIIAKKIGFFGPANFQLILTKKGLMIFEINPRFSSTVLMRNYLGFTDLVWSIEEKFGLKLTKSKSNTADEKIKRRLYCLGKSNRKLKN